MRVIRGKKTHPTPQGKAKHVHATYDGQRAICGNSTWAAQSMVAKQVRPFDTKPQQVIEIRRVLYYVTCGSCRRKMASDSGMRMV